MTEQTTIREVHKMHGSLVHRLFHEPLAMGAEAVPELLMLFADDRIGESMLRAHAPADAPQSSFTVTSDRFGNALPEPTVKDGMAFIPVVGPIIKGAGNLGRWYGMSDMNDVTLWLRDAAQDASVKAITLVIDSPGGFTTGVQEVGNLVSKISRTVKPVMAFTDGTMASAAYWIGGAATFVYGTASSSVGSIGTFIAIADASKFYERMGVKIYVFRSGEYKGLGVDGISDKQADYLQARVDRNASDFKSFIAKHRPAISAEDMNGQSYFGSEAAPKGFLGGIVEDLNEAVARFRGHIS